MCYCLTEFQFVTAKLVFYTYSNVMMVHYPSNWRWPSQSHIAITLQYVLNFQRCRTNFAATYTSYMPLWLHKYWCRRNDFTLTTKCIVWLIWIRSAFSLTTIRPLANIHSPVCDTMCSDTYQRRWIDVGSTTTYKWHGYVLKFHRCRSNLEPTCTRRQRPSFLLPTYTC